jgi:hypothetical protein
MGGHVFVVPGRLESLRCDDVLVSTDAGGDVGESWWPVFGWSDDEGEKRRNQYGPFPDGTRVRLAEDADRDTGEPRRWLADVSSDDGRSVGWLLDGVREALTAAVGHEAEPLGPKRRIALPIMGVSGGGYDQQRGEVIHGLLEAAQRAADEHDVDVVLVAKKLADYSACQSLRQSDHDFPLADEREAKARQLAQLAEAGALAVFMGAGIGIAAGLPSWSALISELAERLGVDPQGLDRLDPLDAGEYLRRAAAKKSDKPAAESARELGCLVGEVIGHPKRYALSHAFLAALDAEQALTTNFDQLYEIAAESIRGTEPLVVLPERHPADFAVRGTRRPWLLKLHGDVDEPERIVLDRRSFVTYDARRRPLGGVLQAALLTRHLLVVGASMTDDNVIRLVHEVAELTEGHREPSAFGTVLSVHTNPVRERLWEPEFDFVDLGGGTDDDAMAARELEIFLDRVALLAAPRSAHLLDPRYRELLKTDEERELADQLHEAVTRLDRVRGENGATGGWDDVAAALGGLGASPQTKRDEAG